MTISVSENTKAILLLTAPLLVGPGAASSEILSAGEYKRLALHLMHVQSEPARLLGSDAGELVRSCAAIIDELRLKRLLERGFQLSQALERWQARSIWVCSRADDAYPKRLKARVRENAPAVLYGCGDRSWLDSGGLAVVGSRHVDAHLAEQTMGIGRLAAMAGRTIISGGARGIDQAAMRGALEAGGKVVGVLADSLEKAVLRRDQRNELLDGRLVLVTPYDPNAGFNVGNAMQRNKLIYAFSDAALVVSSDLNKGGTWAGATEQLDKLRFVPVYVRVAAEQSAGLDALRDKGALPWTDPRNPEELEALLTTPPQASPASKNALGPLIPIARPANTPARGPVAPDSRAEPQAADESSPLDDIPPEHDAASMDAVAGAQDHQNAPRPQSSMKPETGTPANELFAAVRGIIQPLLDTPKGEAEIAKALDVSKSQARSWLDRLVQEDVLVKYKKPVGYVRKSPDFPRAAQHDRE